MQCPICKSIHGTKKGNQPPGTMTVQRMSQSIPGHPGCGCIQITYNIQGGIQVILVCLQMTYFIKPTFSFVVIGILAGLHSSFKVI